jgi:transcription elongation factor Elf1
MACFKWEEVTTSVQIKFQCCTVERRSLSQEKMIDICSTSGGDSVVHTGMCPICGRQRFRFGRGEGVKTVDERSKWKDHHKQESAIRKRNTVKNPEERCTSKNAATLLCSPEMITRSDLRPLLQFSMEFYSVRLDPSANCKPAWCTCPATAMLW